MVHEEVSFEVESNKRFAGTCFFFQKLLCIRASNWSRDRTNKIYSQSKALSHSAPEYTAEYLCRTDKQTIGLEVAASAAHGWQVQQIIATPATNYDEADRAANVKFFWGP